MTETRFQRWRTLHRFASGLLGTIALVHIGMTARLYDRWESDSVWFLGTGMGLLLLAAMNWAHIGLGPCQQPTTKLVRLTNWVFVVFGVATILAVPEPQAYLLVACMFGQAIAAHVTLPGSTSGIESGRPSL